MEETPNISQNSCSHRPNDGNGLTTRDIHVTSSALVCARILEESKEEDEANVEDTTYPGKQDWSSLFISQKELTDFSLGSEFLFFMVKFFFATIGSEVLGKGKKERWSLLLGTWLIHSLAYKLTASPEATKGGPDPGRREWPSGQKRQTTLEKRKEAFVSVGRPTERSSFGRSVKFNCIIEVAFRRPEGSRYQRARPTKVPKVYSARIPSMILRVLAAMAQTKVKRLLAHCLIGHVGYIRTGFSCGTMEGIQGLLIGIFIYASMTIDAFAIVLALRKSRVKYIADLGALAKTNPILAITFSITILSYAGISPLAGFCIKFYLFFAALGCGAYFLALVGVVTSIIGRWAARRLPRLGKNKEVYPNRPMKNKRKAKRQWHAKRMRNEHGEKEGSLEEKQSSSFPSLPGPKAVQSFLAKSMIWGFFATLHHYKNPF
nr:NADH-ubiquinone oxidoreductase chain 2 [Tanacetum cinerariifolium]